MGATTIWERWDSLRPDGTVNPGEMTSFNHYALGAVGDWLHRTVGGLCSGGARLQAHRDLAPARRRAHMGAQPPPNPVRHGRVAWRIDGRRLIVEATVPPNTTAIVTLPGWDEPFEVDSGRHEWVVESWP